MGLGDLGHQQDGKAPQQSEGKSQQRQGHPLEAAVLGHGFGTPAGKLQIDCQTGRHQHILCGVESTGETAASLHRPENVPEALSRLLRAAGRPRTEAAAGLFTVKKCHQPGADGLADRRCPQHCRAAPANVPAEDVGPLQRKVDDADADGLLGQLAQDVWLHLPPGDEKAPQYRRHRHPRQAQRRDTQRPRCPDIAQPPFCGKARQPELRRQRQHAQPGPRQQETVKHPPGLRRAAGQLFGHQAGGRHRDARRRQRDEERVDRQHQLVQSHPLAAQSVRQPDAEPHARQTEQDVRPGHQGCVFQIALPHSAPLPFPSVSFYRYVSCSGKYERGRGLFLSQFYDMIYIVSGGNVPPDRI